MATELNHTDGLGAREKKSGTAQVKSGYWVSLVLSMCPQGHENPGYRKLMHTLEWSITK